MAMLGVGSTEAGWHFLASCNGLNKGTMAAVSLALSLMPHNSVFLSMSLAPPLLLSLCWSPECDCLQARESKCGSFKGTSGFPAAFCLTRKASIPTDFHSHILWGLHFWHWNPGLGNSTAEMSLLMLKYHMCVWNRPVSSFRPSYQSQCGLLFIFPLMGDPFS